MTADNRGRTLLYPTPPAEAIRSTMSGIVMKSRSKPLLRGLRACKGNQSSHLQEMKWKKLCMCHRETEARSSCASLCATDPKPLTSTSSLLDAVLLIKPCCDFRGRVPSRDPFRGHPSRSPFLSAVGCALGSHPTGSGPVSRGGWAAGAPQERGLERGAQGHEGKLRGTEPGASKWAHMGSL